MARARHLCEIAALPTPLMRESSVSVTHSLGSVRLVRFELHGADRSDCSVGFHKIRLANFRAAAAPQGGGVGEGPAAPPQ
jgi:hypothetical protein